MKCSYQIVLNSGINLKMSCDLLHQFHRINNFASMVLDTNVPSMIEMPSIMAIKKPAVVSLLNTKGTLGFLAVWLHSTLASLCGI